MGAFGGPPISDNRATTAPLGSPGSRWPMAAAVLVLVGVTFLVGFRFGGGGVSAPEQGTPPVQLDAVSSVARAVGRLIPRNGWAICAVDVGTIVCGPIRASLEPMEELVSAASQEPAPSSPLSSPGLAWIWLDLASHDLVELAVPTPEGPGAHLVLVAQGSAPAAVLARVDVAQANRGVTPVEPGRLGITYFDLGALTPGQYLVAVATQAPAGVSIALAQVVGLRVCAGELDSASPGWFEQLNACPVTTTP